MATRPIVPRANGEGSLGVSTAGSPKYWGDVFTNRLNNADAKAMASRSTATLRAPLTNYSSGAKCVAAGLPANFLLVCTVGGTTANADITLPATIADTVTFTDGSVTWRVQEIVTTQIFAFRQPSTAVTAASIVFCPGLPSGFYLECKTAGTTDSGAITLPSPLVENAAVTDGTVTWTIRKPANTADIPSLSGYATTSYVDSKAVPAGTIISFGGNNTPSGWLLCDGSAVSRTTYSKLYSAIGTTWGSGNGSTTFNLPSLNGYWLKGSSTAGSSISAGLPNITGSINNDFPYRVWTVGSASGALSASTVTHTHLLSASGASPTLSTLSFNAKNSNSLYGSSSTVSVSSKTVRFIIKY